MNPESMDLLSQLRDIHGAPEAALWPPAPGWWVLAFIVLAALAWLMRGWLARRRENLRRQRLLSRLDEISQQFDPAETPADYLSAVNRLLKIVALRAFPDIHCAGLNGASWVEFLENTPEPGNQENALEGFAPLAAGPYQPVPVFDAEELEGAAGAWIRRYG